MADTGWGRSRSAVAGYPAGVAGRLSFRVLDPLPSPATVIAPMCLPARFARAARLVCLRTALGLLLLPGEEPFLRAIFFPDADELHFAGGLGVALRRFQVDLGIDLSDRIDTASLSVIYGLPG